MKRIGLFVVLVLVSLPMVLSARQDERAPIARDSSALTMDGLRFEVISFAIDSATNTSTATLTITSLAERSRELKVNVYGTQLVDDRRNAYYFSTITMGRVLMRFEDRQNYLHYLLQPNTPVELAITAQGISPEAAAIQVVKIVFEDSEDEGRFLEAYLTAPETE
ncbi:hypothetical protein [Parapedobacter sp. 10938]|uniref:hypothetical protein n=1 Tax=Parapedobacter flavus TaxID=3110225 RepID=UPI002DBB9754|nr:hypothetical protein [Parapedobacter sp. 10938]MEC3880003.1 hypothetical protein [Parapedobacter sp. 10938]